MTEPATVGEGCEIAPTASVPPASADGEPPVLGDGATVREGTIIYPDVEIGPGLSTGHGALIREESVLGADVLVGTNAVIDGRCVVGDGASLQTGAYVPSQSDLGDRTFVGPQASLTNDPRPVEADPELSGPTLEDDVSVGANATILPDVTVGEGSFVAAGAVVTEDVPPETLAIGSPAEHRELPADLEGVNDL